MFRRPPSRVHTFFNSFWEIDYVDPAALLVIGVMGYGNSIRNAAKDPSRRLEILPDLYLSDVMFLLPSIAALTFLTSRAILRAIDKNVHPNRKVALAFFHENPEYVLDKKEDAAKILCPLLMGESEQAVCISYTYEGKKYLHAYDYDALKSYYLTDSGTICPASNISLLSNKVTDLEFSFKIPENTPELIQEKAAEEKAEVTRRPGR